MEIENEDFLIEYLPPMQDKNAIVAIGRFQPPTAGHYKVFNKMKLLPMCNDENKENMTGWQIAQSLKMDRIWDCGTLLFELNI